LRSERSWRNTRSKESDIFEAVRANDVQSVAHLIDTEKEILDKREEGYFKLKPFIVAAKEGHVGVMSVIYCSKPDILQQTDVTGWNAMHIAAREGHAAAVKQLLEWDAKLLYSCTASGETPLMLAARNGHVDVIQAMHRKAGGRHDLLKQKDNVTPIAENTRRMPLIRSVALVWVHDTRRMARRHSTVLYSGATQKLCLSCSSGAAVFCSISKSRRGRRHGTYPFNFNVPGRPGRRLKGS